MYLRSWTGYNWGEKPPYLCDHNFSFSWINSTACPLSFFISCVPCPPDYTSMYPDYSGPYGTPVSPASHVWEGSPLNCTLTIARPGFYKDSTTVCAHLSYCVEQCNPSFYCPGGDSQPVPCPAGLTVQKIEGFYGNVSDCT